MGTVGQKRRSCFEKKGTANFDSRYAESRALQSTQNQPALPPKDNFSAQAKLRDRFQLHQFCERVEAETAIPTPKKISTSSVIINLTRTENQSLQF
jgi:hypothetical protein